MSIKTTEVGKLFNYGTFFDISGYDTLELKFTAPNGTVTTITDPRITVPADDTTDPDIGTLPANTYMQFSTEATDFTIAGTWTVCGTYTDLTPKVFYGDEATFVIGEKC